MDEAAPPPDLLQEGIRLFNERYFFEAHEVWEDLWRRERGEPRLFLQGLIQVAAGFHHYRSGNVRGALALMDKALAKLRRYPPYYMGVDSDSLLAAVQRARDLLSKPQGSHGGDPDIPIPQIGFHGPAT
ncbi:MAG: DUF309 domain-containing protein [Methanobacteriota archaeon]